MKINSIMLAAIIFIGNYNIYGQIPKDFTVKPANGFVPDETTAIAIAKAIWTPIYGEKTIRHESPFHATLTNGVWTVNGSLPKGYKGGVAYAEISKTNGLIIRVFHGK